MVCKIFIFISISLLLQSCYQERQFGSQRLEDSEFYSAAIDEISSCLIHGRDCGIISEEDGVQLPLENKRDFCFENIVRIEMKVEATSANLVLICEYEDIMLEVGAWSDRNSEAHELITFPTASIRAIPRTEEIFQTSSD